MASKCNLLRGLTNNGVFYMFSEYVENLTKSYQQENQYRVVPSTFAMLNLNFTGKNQQYVGEIFQNYYENACSTFRKSDSSILTANGLANELLWKTLYKYGFITISKQDNNFYINELNYVGNIKVTGLEETDGVNYNELWCFVDNNIPRIKYYSTYPANQNAQVSFTGVEAERGMWISGYDATTYPMANADLNGVTSGTFGMDYIDEDNLYRMDDSQTIPFVPYIFTNEADVTNSIVGDEKEYAINTIIVYFDVVDANSKVIYKHIPMGMYFTGNVNESTLTNEIVKVVSDEEIYQQGTSYGLRISTKFACTPQLTTANVLNISGLTGNEADKYCELLAAIADSQSLMQRLVAEQASFDQDVKDHLAMFANYKANVPYVRVVGGIRHWFVNGKDMGTVSPEEQVQNIINVDDMQSVLLKNAAGTKTWLQYYDSDVIDMDASMLLAKMNEMIIQNNNLETVAEYRDNSFKFKDLEVFDSTSNTYKEILSYIKSTIRHDEDLKVKFIIDGENAGINIVTNDWSTIQTITNTSESSIIYQNLNSGDKITIVKHISNLLTPILLNYEYVDDGKSRYYQFVNYTTLWYPTASTTTQDLLKAQLGISEIPIVLIQNYMDSINYIYSPEYDYTSEPFLFYSFNHLNNTIFGTSFFPEDSDKYGAESFDLIDDIQISYPGTNDRKLHLLPIFEATRGEKGIYMQK